MSWRLRLTKLGIKIVRKRNLAYAYAEERGIPTVAAKRLDGWRRHLALGKEVCLGPGYIVLDGDPSPTAAPPHFRPMPIVTKRSPTAATAELLFYILTVITVSFNN